MTAPRRLGRPPVIRAYDHRDTTTFLGRDGKTRRLEGDSAALVRAILGFTATPRSHEEILAHIEALSGSPVAEGGVVDDALALLETSGLVEEARPRAESPPPRRRVRLVLGLTGAIASAYAPGLVEILLARGFDVRVAATRNALRFVSALALEALTHHPVIQGLWPADPGAPVPHLDLARWAEMLVVYPASASSIARLCQGIFDDAVVAAALSTRAPVLVVPSMNEAMYAAPSVQRNLDQLREDGFYLAHPTCGIEVADAPPDRAPRLGSAPPIGALADIIASITAERVIPIAGPPPATDWDVAYRDRRPQDLPWFTEDLDADIAALLDRVDRGAGRFLDAGTGPGTGAIEAARRGFFAVGIDLSPRALEDAAARAGSLPVVWLVDDVLATRQRGVFDVVLDRGLLHVLPRARHPDYAAAVARLVRPGGSLVLKCHAEGAPEALGTERFTRERVTALLGAWFEIVEASDTTFPGPGGAGPPALLCMLRRREETSG